jgi:hypothetical protein
LISSRHDDVYLPELRCAIALRVEEHVCEVWTEGQVTPVGYAPQFPSPRTERVSPGHLVAIARTPSRKDVAVWRWYDALVLGEEPDNSVRLWEPAHGEVVAQPRQQHQQWDPGSRAYLSAGLPGADWWVAGPVVVQPDKAQVELNEVRHLYTENGLWEEALSS